MTAVECTARGWLIGYGISTLQLSQLSTLPPEVEEVAARATSVRPLGKGHVCSNGFSWEK